jgi:glycosyltransferase involved in cell wall biosynthesis
MKIAIWTITPNHYQSAFHDAVRRLGTDTRVVYFGEVSQERHALGWKTVGRSDLLEEESFLNDNANLVENIADWKERVHVVPGGRTKLLRSLVRSLSKSGVEWVHWSEPSSPGWKRLAGSALRYWYGQYVNRYALGAFGTGHMAMDDLRRWGIRRFRIASLPYVVAPSVEPNDGREREARPPTFVYVGQLCQRKGIDVLLGAFREVARDYPSARLILAGADGSKGLYTRMAERLGVSKQTSFTGPVPIGNVRGLMRSATAVVLPSRHDGWGVVLSEAAAEGLALIATETCGAARDLIEPGYNGFVVASESVEQLAAAMKVYAEDPARALQHGRHSRMVSARFTPDHVASTFLETLSAWRGAGARAN